MSAFGAAEVIYNSLLPEIAAPEDRDTVSSKGYAYGYIGGGVLLALNLALFLGAGKIGITEGMAVRISLCSAGIWWAFYDPDAASLHNRGPAHRLAQGQERAGDDDPSNSPTRSARSRKYPQTTIFLIAFFSSTTRSRPSSRSPLSSAADELKIPQAQMTLTILMVQFVAFFGAIGFNWIASKTSAKRAVVDSPHRSGSRWWSTSCG